MRVTSTQQPTNRDLYIVQYCLVVLAPPIMASVIYVAFGRIVFLVVPPESRKLRLLWVPGTEYAQLLCAFVCVGRGRMVADDWASSSTVAHARLCLLRHPLPLAAARRRSKDIGYAAYGPRRVAEAEPRKGHRLGRRHIADCRLRLLHPRRCPLPPCLKALQAAASAAFPGDARQQVRHH